MNQDLILKKVKEKVREKLEGEGSGHDWWHIVRVYNSAVYIGKEEEKNENLDLFVVKLSSLLHDMADHKFGYNDEDRSKIIHDILNKLNVDKKIIDHVVYIANNISFKGGKNKNKMETLEGKIVQDADRLDAIGAIGIGRAFSYGGYKKRVMYNPEDDKKIHEKEDTISHFYEKILLLKDKMNTKVGYENALKRHKFVEGFLEEFYSEWDGNN